MTTLSLICLILVGSQLTWFPVPSGQMVSFQHTRTPNTPSDPKTVRNPTSPEIPNLQDLSGDRELKGGEKHRFPFQLPAGSFLKFVVMQKGIDVVVRLVGPDGKTWSEIDSPNGIQGIELLSGLGEQAGTYVLEIEALEKTAPTGMYEIQTATVKLATAQDRAEAGLSRLNIEVTQLVSSRKFDQALLPARQAVDQANQLPEIDPMVAAVSFSNLALVYQSKGELLQAVPLFLRTVEIEENILGPRHPEVTRWLSHLVDISLAQGDSAKTATLYQRILTNCEKAYGPDHSETIAAFQKLADSYKTRGDSAQAVFLYEERLSLREKALGSDHPNLIPILIPLADLYYYLGDFVHAEQRFQRVLEVREKALGPDHPKVATDLNNLADIYRLQGYRAKAESLYRRALAIQEKALGPEHPDTARTLNFLGILYHGQSEYVAAEPFFQRSLLIREKVFGPDDPVIAENLNNLGVLYKDKGDLEKAEAMYWRALKIWEKAFGPEHQNIGFIFNNLGIIAYTKGDYPQSEARYLRALAIWEKAFGPNQPNLAICLNNLANTYREMGNYLQAEQVFGRSLAIYEKAFGPDHPSVAISLNNLAVVFRLKGDFDRAVPLLQRAQAIFEKTLGPEHLNVGSALNNLAATYHARGETALAVECMSRSNHIIERDLVRNLIVGSENQKALYLKQTLLRTDQTISLHVQAMPQSKAARQMAMTVLLRRKGRTLDAMSGAIAVLRNRQDGKIQKLFDEYANLASRISTLTLQGPGQKKPEDHLADIRALEEQKDQLEDEISRQSQEFQSQNTPITLEAVQDLIPGDAALIEYGVYRIFDPKTSKVGNSRYVAYVLHRNGEIQFSDLGDVGPIDQAVVEFRKYLKNRSGESSDLTKRPAQVLERLIIKPVRALLGPTRHLLVSPDGGLNLIPFAALMDEKGKYLVEKYTLTYLTSGRDLLRLQYQVPAKTPGVIVANPDYDIGQGPLLAGMSPKPLLPLPGTAKEGKEIQKLLKNAKLIVQAEATKDAVKAVQQPEILHIATHGYFLKDVPFEAQPSETQHLTNRQSTSPSSPGNLRFENPLLRSWLFFAGANRGGSNDNDGIMTALEAAQLNLWGTKLVTLSACETGVGEAKNGDGVYGLRRALVLAGSEAQLMSLWSVSDQATRKLMVDYYTRLKAGEGRSEALRNVQLEMLKDPRRGHPFYWASFIQSGEWASLDGKR